MNFSPMKIRLCRITALAILLPALLLTACTGGPTSASSASESAASAAPSPSPSALPPVPSPAPTNWHSGVKTDYSGLTPYRPLQEKYTRLSPGPLPALKPAANYGKLMPYIGATMYGVGGYLSFNMYGLVTAAGMIVTDPVFARAFQGSYFNYIDNTSIYVPAFDLLKLADKIDKDNPWKSVRHAVCALDGSWVTDFDYSNIFFADTVILAVRNNEKNDVDVLDYNGKLLYNSTVLGCYSQIASNSAYAFISGYGDGLMAVPLTNGKTAYIDAPTGTVHYAPYALGEAFFGGYARVRTKETGLYGYMNRDFTMVIQPQFLFADFFSGGKAVVQLQDNSYAVIDQTGKTLFKSPNTIGRMDSSIYGVYDSGGTARFYDSNLKEIAADGMPLKQLNGGWFYYTTADGAVVLNGSEKHTISGVKEIEAVSGGLVCYYVNTPEKWSQGVKALDGRDIVPLTDYSSIYLTTGKTGSIYIVVATYSKSGMDQTYKVLDKNGKTVLSGKGWANYNAQVGLFEVNDVQSFGYTDDSGAYVFRISLLQYLPD